MAEIRAAIAGEVASAEGVEAVRAALTRTFRRFVLHRADSPNAPERAHMELAAVSNYVIEPIIREPREGEYPDLLPSREPLVQAANKLRQGVGYR